MKVRGLLGVAAVMAVVAADGSASAERSRRRSYEVWVVDQSDSRGVSYGGTVYIYSGSDLSGKDPGSASPVATIDLGAETSALCQQRTGANPVRPHMVLFNREQTHAVLAFVASGHVVIFDAAERTPLECARTTQAPTGRQAHAAFPAPDGSYVLIANQNGKRLERIDSDFRGNTFVHNVNATLDLATCTTPSGASCQAANVRPDNAPICPVLTDEGDLAFVTLRGGGMLVVDPRATPMRIVAEYDMSAVKGNGCGGVQVGDRMYVNSGGRPAPLDHLHVYGFDVYRFGLHAFRGAGGGFAVNTPAPAVVFTAEGQHDSHGMVTTGLGRFIWVMDRHADVVEVLSAKTDAHLRTLPLNGAFTDNAAPDLTDISPLDDRVFVAFRGPTPLSGDPHNARGSTPGLAIIEVLEGGRSGRVIGLIRMTNVGADGVERADPHGLRVRRLK